MFDPQLHQAARAASAPSAASGPSPPGRRQPASSDGLGMNSSFETPSSSTSGGGDAQMFSSTARRSPASSNQGRVHLQVIAAMLEPGRATATTETARGAGAGMERVMKRPDSMAMEALETLAKDAGDAGFAPARREAVQT